MRVIKSTYYSNWGDLFGYRIANIILPVILKLHFLTPNMVTFLAFTSFVLGCIMLLLPYPLMAIGGFFIFAGYIGDDLDGQLARATKKNSVFGNHLDKVFDVVKIFAITFSAGLSVYFTTYNVFYIVLGFIACFFFMLRYYIKLETMFSATSQDNKYLEKSSQKRSELERTMDHLYARKAKNIKDGFYIGWVKMRTMLLVDEAEFAIFICVGAFLNQVGFALFVIALAQVSIAIWRGFERGIQLKNNSERLLWPMRK